MTIYANHIYCNRENLSNVTFFCNTYSTNYLIHSLTTRMQDLGNKFGVGTIDIFTDSIYRKYNRQLIIFFQKLLL